MIRDVAGRSILTGARMRAAESRAFAEGRATPEGLMAEAGLAVARAVRRIAGDRRIVVAAGTGGNGGDGYAAAQHLASWGQDVIVVAFGAASHPAARAMAARWNGRRMAAAEIDRPFAGHLLIDALFGIGGRRSDDPPAGWRAVSERAAVRVAIDLPSGIDVDTGAVDRWSTPADLTVALGALKPAHMLAPDRCGHILFAGFGEAVGDDEEPRWSAMPSQVIAPPGPADHKYRGRVTIVAGAMPGAARLAARGAAGVGAGYVVLLGDPAAAGPLDSIVYQPADRLDQALEGEGVVLVGPGLGRDGRARDILDRALASRAALVLDGDALTLMGDAAAGRLAARTADTILTPHEGEFARMFGDDGGSKFARTQAAAATSGATVVHKGRCTVIGYPRGELRASAEGSTWLATAGTGDVLAGAVAARSACERRGSSARPVEQAVQLHARASVLAGAAFSADRLADHLPIALAECL